MTLDHDLVGPLSAYVETAAVVPLTGAELAVTFDFAIAAELTESFALEAGARVGLNDAAEDLAVFVGAATRI